jgi:hypothetical protein
VAAEELLSVDKALWRKEAAGHPQGPGRVRRARARPKLVAMDELERRLGA